ncbi:MAG: 2Fe-2S iron-sulfur cluster-binding protein [Dehalococcoidia bacterium]|nr:2Fe-2S iron-sulfur cluster-binding protein [Dehalococcoidia bacterium]
MAKFVNLTIDGQKVRAHEGQTILEAAKNRPGIGEIPVLCDNKNVAPYGACRICSVEIKHGNHSRLVASCLYPVEEGLDVQTNSERVLKLRKGIIELLLARCPNVEVIKNMAAGLGVTKPRFEAEDSECILCGLCVRVCAEVTGNKVMSLVNRGVDREVAAPFYEELPKKCIGCGDCMYICPTKAIRMGPDNKVILPRPKSLAAAK